MHCTLRTLPPSPPHSNTHCHESSENFLYKIYQVLGILPILINNRSDTVVQWISAGLVWSRTWVQSYKKLDFFSVIGNRISNTSYHFQYLYYPGGNETGAKPNLITCITEIFWVYIRGDSCWFLIRIVFSDISVFFSNTGSSRHI